MPQVTRSFDRENLFGSPSMPTNFLSYLETHAAKELVRYAVSAHMFCPECDRLLEMTETVILTDTADHTITLCARCYGRPVGNIKAGSVTVYDGRALWPSRSTKQWRWK